jgi:hypothetical protein
MGFVTGNKVAPNPYTQTIHSPLGAGESTYISNDVTIRDVSLASGFDVDNLLDELERRLKNRMLSY